MYEAVTARPAGESTVARMALTAAEYGYDGIVVRNPGNRLPDYDRDAVREAYGIDVVEGVEITAGDPSKASGFLGNHRPERTVVALRGGTNALNRFAVEQPAVDVLARPFGYGGAGGDAPSGGKSETRDEGDGHIDGVGGSDEGSESAAHATIGGSGWSSTVDVDHVLAKTAADNGVRIEFSLAPIRRESGGSRVRAIQSLRKLRELVEQYDAPYVVTGGARSHLGLRASRELLALGEVIGFTQDEVEAGLREWQGLAERNRKRQSDEFVEPGVWRCDDE